MSSPSTEIEGRSPQPQLPLLPGPVAQDAFRLDGIVTMVDANHIEQHLDEEKPEGAENESVEQVAFADRLILNKVPSGPTPAPAILSPLRAANASSHSCTPPTFARSYRAPPNPPTPHPRST